jgi:hypothetical protein
MYAPRHRLPEETPLVTVDETVPHPSFAVPLRPRPERLLRPRGSFRIRYKNARWPGSLAHRMHTQPNDRLRWVNPKVGANIEAAPKRGNRTTCAVARCINHG